MRCSHPPKASRQRVQGCRKKVGEKRKERSGKVSEEEPRWELERIHRCCIVGTYSKMCPGDCQKWNHPLQCCSLWYTYCEHQCTQGGAPRSPPPTTSLQCAALAYSLFDCHPPIVSESLEAMGFVHPLSLTDKFAWIWVWKTFDEWIKAMCKHMI